MRKWLVAWLHTLGDCYFGHTDADRVLGIPFPLVHRFQDIAILVGGGTGRNEFASGQHRRDDVCAHPTVNPSTMLESRHIPRLAALAALADSDETENDFDELQELTR